MNPSKVRLSAAIVMLFLAGRAFGADATGAGNASFSFLQAPPGAQLVTFSLAVSESASPRPSGYLVQRSNQAAEESASVPASIAQGYEGKEFSAFQIAELPNGTRYLAVLNEDKNLKFLNRSDFPMCYARIYKITRGGDAKPELLREGYQSQGNDVTVPVEIELPGIGSTKLKTLHTELGYSFQGFQNGKPQVYVGRGAGIQVAGSQVLQQGKLTLNVTVPDEMTVSPDTQVTLRFAPLQPGLPERTASGKVTDFLTLGTARFVVTELASDFASATLAIVAGSLEETLKQQLQLGAELPPFSQVELVSRRTCTREQLLERARNAGGVVFIFGDLASTGGRSGPPYYPPSYGGPATSVLPMPAGEIVEQLELERKSKPVVVFVTRQISIEFLYQELRNKTPDYLVLTDYADPLRTSFRLPQGPGGYYGPSYPGAANEPSLRQLFNLPERLAIAAFDRSGKVIYVKADAGSEFLRSIAEARTALPD